MPPHYTPEAVGSGGTPPSNHLPKFPNIPDLVQDEENAHLLSALLPVLKQYKCLQFSTVKTKRSPWVRTFVDLYHPGAGPWGKFSNAPSITSSTRYNFKSYKIPKIFEQLEKYKGNNPVHLALYRALKEYMDKELWYKSYMVASEQIAAHEVNKPAANRTPIPTVNEIHPPAPAHASASGDSTEIDPPATVYASTPGDKTEIDPPAIVHASSPDSMEDASCGSLTRQRVPLDPEGQRLH